MVRPEYFLKITLNSRNFCKIKIDQHYKINHFESINDALILSLIKTLDGKTFVPENIRDNFEYYKVEPVFLKNKPYRLILIICLTDNFIGVINAFRIEKDTL